MKIVSRLALALALALVVAVPALAATTFTTGDWAGTTSQRNGEGKKRKITFHADAAAGEITNMKFRSAGTCSDEGTSGGEQKNLHSTVGADGKFTINAVSQSGATTLKLTGTIVGNKASGSFTLKSRFNKRTNKPDKNGSIKCSSGLVKWSAAPVG